MRIHQNNLKTYLKNTYGGTPILKQQSKIENFPQLLQADYGEANDCTLTSMTAIVYFLSNGKYSVETIYDYVEQTAKKYGYRGASGTPLVTIRKIFHNSLKKFKLPKAFAKYGKDLGFTFKNIQGEINKKNPLILSIDKDGRNYYNDHSVTVIGYEIYSVGAQEVIILLLQDNWYKSIGYLDYNRVSTVATLHYSDLTVKQKCLMWRKLKNLE